MSSQKRILKELSSIWSQQYPVQQAPNADVELSGVKRRAFVVHANDLRLWHVTFRNNANPTVPFTSLHAAITFPETYPSVPPVVKFFTMLPHPNLVQELDEELNTNSRFCMPLLDVNPGSAFSGWSSAIQMSGLLTQIASMIFDSDLMFCVSKIPLATAAANALAFHCEHCSTGGRSLELFNSWSQRQEGGVDNECRTTFSVALPSVTRTRCYGEFKVPIVSRRVSAPQKAQRAWATVGTKSDPCSAPQRGGIGARKLPPPPKEASVEANEGVPSPKWKSVKKKSDTIIKMTPCHICERKFPLNFFSKKQQHVFLKTKMKPVCRACKSLGHRDREARGGRGRGMVPAKKRKGLSKFSGNEMMHIFMFLGPTEACKMATVSKLCKQLLNYPILWKGFLSRHLRASGQSHGHLPSHPMSVDWKRVYALTVGNRMDHLKCFHTLQDFKESVLGYPVAFTVNPKTRQSDYILATPDVLSHHAFTDGVCTTIGNEPFDEFFPMYICKDHFKRALPILTKFIAKLAEPNMFKPTFTPELVLDVIPRILKTMVVLLANGGLQLTSRVLNTLISIFRVLVACVDEFPCLKDIAKTRLRKFMGHPMNRTKDVIPSIGTMWWLLAICPEVDVHAFNQKYFFESIDRSALWVLRDSPLLERMCTERQSGAHPFVLDAWLKQRCAGSNRIHMIHWTIVNEICRPGGKSVADTMERYDWMLGGGTKSLHRTMKDRLTPILASSPESTPWAHYFKQVEFVDKAGNPPSEALLTKWFMQAVKNSESRNYHTKGMDFSQVHRNGQSKLLNRGQSCSLSTSGNIRIVDTWHWKGERKFLDVSLLFFDTKGRISRATTSRATGNSAGIQNHILDYRNTQLFRGAAQHSGDQIDDVEQRGTHSVDLRLHGLPQHIKYIYIVLSAWDSARLKDILLPSVGCIDSKTGTEICRYSYKEKESVNSQVKNIVMCRVWRPSAGAAWKFEALGSEGSAGHADSYGPIEQKICAELREEVKDSYVNSHPMSLFAHRTRKKKVTN